MTFRDVTDDDATEIGRQFMQRLPEGYCWNISPIEYLTQIIDERDDMGRDAKRYRYLRSQQWNDNTIAVVRHPKDAVKLGYDCPSGARLDEFVDAAMENSND